MAVGVDSPTMFGSKGDPNKDVGPSTVMPGDKRGSYDDDPEKAVAVVRELKRRFADCKDHKWAIVRPSDWNRFALIYGDQQWGTNVEEWQSTPTINLTFAAINAILPIITDNRPQIAVVAREPDDVHIAEVITRVLEWLWEFCNLDMLLPKTMLNTLIFGNGFWKIMWDQSLRKGLGDICVRNVDPTNMFFNPQATSIDDAEEMYHVEQMSMEWIGKMYPDKVHLVKAGPDDPSILVNRPHRGQVVKGRGDPIEVRSTTGAQTYMYPPGSSLSGEAAPKESATVYERWKFEREESRWRRTVVANNVLLVNEITDFDTPPFVHFVDYPVAWTLWGTGEVQHVESLQYEINRRRGMILDILRHASMPMIVVDPAAGVDPDSIKARPGLVIPAEGGPAAVGSLSLPMDLAGLFGVCDRDKQDFNDILGNVDIVQGKAPQGIEAGIALEMLSESANTRLRLKVRLMEASLRRAGLILLKTVQKHYTGERVFRIVGSEMSETGQPQAPEFFNINTPAGVGMNPETQEPVPTYDETSNHIPEDAEFDIRIGAGSTLPVSKTAKFQQAITLFDRGALDVPELLKSANWPRWEQVWARIQMAQQQQMMMQAGAGMEGAMPPIPESGEELMGEMPPGAVPEAAEVA